jgi:fructose-bisphosphate aldolase class 1
MGIDFIWLQRARWKTGPEHARRMVFMSGGTFTEEARTFLQTTAQPSIEKPFTASYLRDVIAGMLESDVARD